MLTFLSQIFIQKCSKGFLSSKPKRFHFIMVDFSRVFIVVFIIMVTTVLPRVVARPGIYKTPVTTDKPAGCFFSDEVDELCQQCAKHTKSNIVYPLCCNNEDDARSFCRAFLDFGI